MTTGNVLSGISASLDQARQNIRGNPRSFNLMEPIVHTQVRLGKDVPVTALAEGDWVSIEHDRCYPLSAGKPFGGLFHTMSQDAHGITVSCIVRGAVHVRVEGLSAEHRRGTPVHADLTTGSRPRLNVQGNGPKIGTLYQAESIERGIGILLFKADFDERPFADVHEPKEW